MPPFFYPEMKKKKGKSIRSQDIMRKKRTMFLFWKIFALNFDFYTKQPFITFCTYLQSVNSGFQFSDVGLPFTPQSQSACVQPKFDNAMKCCRVVLRWESNLPDITAPFV